MKRIPFQEAAARYPKGDPEGAGKLLASRLEKSGRKLVVLDDDPTGIQTVHDVSVYTDWSQESIDAGFQEENRTFFILTNSRSFSAQRTEEVHREIALRVAEAARKSCKDYLLVSRGDSTLRGHYPLETETLRRTLEQQGELSFDGEIILPFFREGGRYTLENIHYVLENDILTPAGETEFAKDKTFGYRSSDLREWVEEKTKGTYRAGEVTEIPLSLLRRQDVAAVTNRLEQVTGFGKVIVNALDECDVMVFCAALYDALDRGKRFLYRTAAAFVKAAGGITSRPLLSRRELIPEGVSRGGLIIAASHTKKTTAQLGALKTVPGVEFVTFDQHLALWPEKLEAEAQRTAEEADRLIRAGRTAAVCTRRERLDLNTGNPEDELRIATAISDAVTSIAARLTARPSFILAKGGITSSDVGVKALKVRRARAAGQIQPGVPVWFTGEESRFPGMPYIIFPGNVGTEDTLKKAVSLLMCIDTAGGEK